MILCKHGNSAIICNDCLEEALKKLGQQVVGGWTQPKQPVNPTIHDNCFCGATKLRSEAVCQGCQWRPAPSKNYSVPVTMTTTEINKLKQYYDNWTGAATTAAEPPCRYCKGTKKIAGFASEYDCEEC